MFALFVLNGIKGNLEEWRTRFGFLYSSFEPECWYWEVVEVSKKGICSNLLSIGFSNDLLLTLLKICLHTQSFLRLLLSTSSPSESKYKSIPGSW